MSKIDVKVRKAEDHGDIAVIELDGQIDSYTLPDFEKALNSAIHQDGFVKLVIDCSKLSFINSSGIGVITVALGDVEENGGELKIAGLSDEVYSAFDLLGFADILAFFPTEQEALRDFSH
jgi:anti-sigma B factor antagonist